MSEFQPQKLSVTVMPPASWNRPVEGRKYTLTHSDLTGELFLDIGYLYDAGAIDWRMRDEVLAEWIQESPGAFILSGKVHVDGGEFNPEAAEKRYGIFRKEMDTALKAIVYGDRPFYASYPSLLDAPIRIRYESSYPAYRTVLVYGTPRSYLEQVLEGSV